MFCLLRQPGARLRRGRCACRKQAEDRDYRSVARPVPRRDDDVGKEHLVTNVVSHVEADVKPQGMPPVIEYRRACAGFGAQVRQLN
jgi:hypothetical protein